MLWVRGARPTERPVPCPAERYPQRPRGELLGEMPFVAGRAALVRAGPAVLGGDLAGPHEARLGGRRAPQEVLGLGRREVLRANGGEGQPCPPTPLPPPPHPPPPPPPHPPTPPPPPPPTI